MLTKLAGDMWLAVTAAYKAGDAAGVSEHGGRLLQLLLDMDTLLASVPCASYIDISHRISRPCVQQLVVHSLADSCSC